MHLHGFPLERIIVPILREARMKERVASYEHAAPFARKGGRIIAVSDLGTAAKFTMNQRGVRGVDSAQPVLPHSQTIVYIVVHYLVTFIEAPKRLERVATSQEARPGYRDDVALG